MRTYVLDPAAKKPLYEQLYAAIKTDILSGVMTGGTRLPSKRALAEHLNISCITVENAYAQLLTEGYVISRPRSGYYVEQLDLLPQQQMAEQPKPIPPDVRPPAASAAQFPFSVWAKLMRGVLLDNRDQLLQPAPNTGLPALRQAIAGMLRRSRGMEVSPECIVIGAGAEYLYNILIQLLGREHIYGLEDPGHEKIRRVYEANHVRIRPMKLDEFGVSLEALTQSDVSVLHISPGHQFPTGLVTPIGRRQQLMTWLSQRPNRWIVEDDYDSEFRFSGRVIPSMYSMDTIGRVIYLNTFSKTITPALRISYLILPPALMEQYRQRLGFYSCTVPVFEQLALAKFLDDGYFEKHVSRMKRHYRILRDQLLQRLRQSPRADAMTVQGAEAGLHFLLQLRTGLPDAELERQLTLAGVRAASLRRYEIVPQQNSGCLVIFYSDLAEADLHRVVSCLEKLVDL